MLAWIKKWWWAMAAVVVMALLYSMCGSCTTDWKARYNEEKGKYEAYRAIAGADARAMQERIDALEDVKAAQSVVIAERDATIAAKNNDISSGNKKLESLESEYETLGQDKDAKITNLQSQVATLKGNLTLAYSIIEDKDAQITAWQVKFAASEQIFSEWKKAYEDEHRLRLMAEGLVTSLEKKQSRTLFVSKLKNVALVGLAGVAAYNLIKK
jgi:uncharacterized coiled-coil protein SlyX